MPYSATGAWCDVAGAPRVGVGYSFTLALLKLDAFYEGLFTPSYEARFPSVGAHACGGAATMQCDWGTPMTWYGGSSIHDGYIWGVANAPNYDDLPEEQQAAVAAWFGQLPDGWEQACCYVFSATAQVGGLFPDGTIDRIYKAFGWCSMPGQPDEGGVTFPVYNWVGDNEWVLGGSLAYNNLQCKLNTTDHWSQKFAFRHWSHRSANYGLFTSADETTSTATIGGASATAVSTFDEQTGPGFGAAITQPWTCAPNTDYAQVQGVSSNLGDVQLDLYMSLWSQPYNAISSAPNWVGAVERPAQPEGEWPYVWHFFCDGGTFSMHAVELGWWGPDHGHIYGTAGASVFGPVRFDVQAGRGGYGDSEESPLPGGFLVDVGLRHWISETETEIVWLGPGTSRYYSFCIVGIWYNSPGTAIKTGSYHFGNVAPTIKEEWLEDNKDLLTYQHTVDGDPFGGEISNRRCWLAVPSLEASPDNSAPYWGDALHYVWSEVSIDAPPGYEERPTLWAAGTGATVDPEDNGKWTASARGAVISRSLASRFDARMGYLAVGWDVGKPPYDRDWPIIAKANHQLAADPPEVAGACEVEDVTNYDNSRILRFSFKTDQYPENVDWKQARLKITYAMYDIRDEWYIQPAYNGWNRFGAEGVFEYDSWDADFTFKGYGEKLPPGQPPSRHLFFDLAELPRSNTVNLRHVRAIELILPTAGAYELDDARLIEDPALYHDVQAHGGQEYPHLTPQQGTNPWNWVKCACGWGSTFEGMPHLNIPNGSESYFNKDVQYGIKGLQYWQYNPMWLADQEVPPEPFDPTGAWNLQRLVAVLGLQEQLTGTYLDTGNVGAAMSDEHGNSLGFLYFWDLDRPYSDCGSQQAALTVGTIEAFGITCPLIPMCANVRWSTHGRGQGMAYQGGTFVRMEGVSTDDGDDGAAQVWKRPLDDDGNTVLDENGDPMPWQVCGSFSPDPTGRFITPPLPESGWEYKTNTWGPGRYVTREYQYLTAWFPTAAGRPVLAISTHHVANAELVSDVGLCSDTLPGHSKLQRGNDGLVWSDRFAMDDGDTYRWGNILACTDRTEYILDDDYDTFLRQAKSLDGEYLDPYKVAEGYLRPFMIEVQGRLLLTAVRDGNCYLVTLAKGAPHAMVGQPVLIGPATEKAATSLAYCVPHGLLFAAVQTAGGEDDDESEAPSVTIYSSTSRGEEWQATGQTAALAFPYLYGDDATLWMVGFDPTPTGGAEGKAKVLKFAATRSLAAPQTSADVGPADKGRPAIIRRPVGGELIVAAGKVNAWDEEAPFPSIVEYRSIDSGQTWQKRTVHELL